MTTPTYCSCPEPKWRQEPDESRLNCRTCGLYQQPAPDAGTEAILAKIALRHFRAGAKAHLAGQVWPGDCALVPRSYLNDLQKFLDHVETLIVTPPTQTRVCRRCAICNQVRGGVWAFSIALKELGFDIAENAYAHGSCITQERRRQEKQKRVR